MVYDLQVGPAQYDMSMKAGKQIDVRMEGTLPRLSLEQSTVCASGNATESSGWNQTLEQSADSSSKTDGSVLPAKSAKSAAYAESSLAQEFAQKFGLADEEPLDSEPAERKSPLTWFGVMVPQALRGCQTQFENALEIAVKLAELRSQMQMLQQGPGGTEMSSLHASSQHPT